VRPAAAPCAAANGCRRPHSEAASRAAAAPPQIGPGTAAGDGGMGVLGGQGKKCRNWCEIAKVMVRTTMCV